MTASSRFLARASQNCLKLYWLLKMLGMASVLGGVTARPPVLSEWQLAQERPELDNRVSLNNFRPRLFVFARLL